MDLDAPIEEHGNQEIPLNQKVYDWLLGLSSEERREQALTRTHGPLVGLTCKEALDEAAAHLTREGASITNRSDNSISFTYHKRAHLFPLRSRDVHFALTAMPTPGGCRLLFGGEYGAGYDEFRPWMKSAPTPNPAITYPKVLGPLQEEGAAHPDIPTQIQKLAELP